MTRFSSVIWETGNSLVWTGGSSEYGHDPQDTWARDTRGTG